jgi:predicted Zn-dependent peptidase
MKPHHGQMKRSAFSIIIKRGILPLALLLAVAVPGFIHSQESKPQEKSFSLDNGMKVFLYERHTLPMLNVVAAVNAGSKNETEETSGLAHLLEHYILFRGTEVRSGGEISRDIRRHGAYFNAHTGQDLATFEISLPSDFADFALQNQKEILFNLKFVQAEIDSEKDVIFEEISQIEDDPFRFASALVYQNLFKGHPYQKPIYGKKESLKAVTLKQLEDFYKTYFHPANCALAIVGDFAIKEMEDKVRAVFGAIKREPFAPPKFEKAVLSEKAIEIEQELDVQEAYLVIGMIGPGYNSPDQFAMDVLTEVLGRGIRPLLNVALRGDRDLINGVSMSYLTLKYSGASVVYFTLEPKNLNAAKRQAIQYLRQRARSENYAKADVYGEAQMYAFDYLESAKNQIRFSIQQSQEDGLTLASSLAMHLILSEGAASPNYLENIGKISTSDLRKVAAKYLSPDGYVVVSIIPKKK